MDAFWIVGLVDAYAEFLEEIVHAQHRARLQLRVLLDKHHRRSFAYAGRCLEPIEAVRKSILGARWVLLAVQRLRHRLRGALRSGVRPIAFLKRVHHEAPEELPPYSFIAVRGS